RGSSSSRSWRERNPPRAVSRGRCGMRGRASHHAPNVFVRLFAAVAVVALLASPGRALAQEPDAAHPLADVSIESWMSEGRIHLELVAGYGWALNFTGSRKDELSRQYVVVSPRLGMFPLGVVGEAPFRGSLEIGGQLTAFSQTRPHGGYAAGTAAFA